MDIESTQTIHSRAPTRIDLAGGTVDLWPLYLFLKNPLTLNLGIDLYAEATIEITPSSSSSGQVLLRSQDQNAELKSSWEALAALTPPPSLELHTKLLKFFLTKYALHHDHPPTHDFVLSTRARSPAGAGLGGSSTLSIAMIGALATWASHPVDPQKNGEDFIEIVRDVETTVIQVPAGLQDYYGAMYGGLQTLRWQAGSHQRTAFSPDLIPELEKRLLLFYSGQSRNSGINNWALFKGFIDRQDEVRSKFQKIVEATQQLETALKNRDWAQVGQAIAAEWGIRKTLAPGITTPEIDQAFAEARKLAPISGKVCGAGGGGCFFVYIPLGSSSIGDIASDDESQKALPQKIKEIFIQNGMRPLDFHGVAHGLDVQINPQGMPKGPSSGSPKTMTKTPPKATSKAPPKESQ